MSPLLFVLVCMVGGAGATARLIQDGVIRARVTTDLPWGTITINVAGSFLLGLSTALVASRVLPQDWNLILGSGFLGGYTTFSTASFETVSLLRERRWGLGLVNGVGTVVVTTLAAGGGLWLGGLG